MIPGAYLAGGAAVACALAFAIGYDSGRDSRALEIGAINAVATATSQRNRAITEDARNVQSLYLASWNARRAQSRAEWLRDKARVDRGVSAVQSECGSPGGDTGAGLGSAEPPVTAGEISDALEVGRLLGDKLRLCRSELRTCEGLRQ